MLLGEKRKKTNERNKFPLECIVIIFLAIFFIARCIAVINSYRERGGFAYVQLLNYSMPVVENLVYDKADYAENQINIKKVIFEAIGLSNISTYGIVGSEISFFNNINSTLGTSTNNSSIANNSPFSISTPYEVKEESVAKMTEEEINQLNQQSQAYDETLKKTLDESIPEVLIYHTHTHEAYSDGGDVNSGYNYNTDNTDFSVVGVGDILEEELKNNYGISVIHDKTVHDASYNECYVRSNETVQSYLNQFGDFKLIIDLHRDSSSNRNAVSTEINDESLARIMFVTAGNSERYSSNLALANRFTEITNSLFPNLLRDTSIYEYDIGQRAFNLSLSDNMLLIEDGSIANTALEAKLTAKYIARIIAEYINR